jgi:bifunctional non-homologous end joining protein LigD
MQPQLAKPFHRDGWVYEEKVDGWRILAVKRGGVVRLWSRTGRDHADRFPDVSRAVAALPGRELVVDGEVAVFDEQLLSRFEYLTVPPPPEVVITPPVYVAFDVLQVRGRDLRARPLTDRRRALEDLVDGSGRATRAAPARRRAGGLGDRAGAWLRGAGRERSTGGVPGKR